MMPFVASILLGSVTSIALTHGLPLGPEPRTCVDLELRARTVRVQSSRASCSGVVTGPTTVRTASHCFGLSASVGGVFDARGARLGEDGRVRRVGGLQYAPYDVPDQAELTFDEPISSVGPVAFANVADLAVGNRAVIAGYGYSAPKRPVWKHLFPEKTLKYIWGTLIKEPGRDGRFAYRFTPDHPGAAAAMGDSGAPAFLVEECRLSFVGTVVGRRLSLRKHNLTYVRPHTDLGAAD